jgi:ankyrin repeat protein
VESGNWNTAEEFLKRQPDAVSAKITYLGQTVLHLAVRAGHEDIVEKLVNLMSKEDLAIPSTTGITALAYAISAGNYRMAACMLGKNKNLLRIKDSNKVIPVNQAIFNGHIELARYLYSLTSLEHLTLERGVDGATLCTQAIYNQSLGKKQLFA